MIENALVGRGGFLPARDVPDFETPFVPDEHDLAPEIEHFTKILRQNEAPVRVRCAVACLRVEQAKEFPHFELRGRGEGMGFRDRRGESGRGHHEKAMPAGIGDEQPFLGVGDSAPGGGKGDPVFIIQLELRISNEGDKR